MTVASTKIRPLNVAVRHTKIVLPMQWKKISYVLSLVVIGMGALVLAGWMFGLDALKRIHPQLVTMKANTGVCLILAGTALALLRDEGAAGLKRRLAQGCAAGIAMVGALTLCQDLSGWDFGIDQFLFPESVTEAGRSVPGRMNPASAVNFVLLGIALFSIDLRPKRVWTPAQVCTVAVIGFTLLIFLAYFYNIEMLQPVELRASIALHTVLAFLLLCGAILLARPDRGIMAIFLADSAAGIVARRLIPSALLAPALLGWLKVVGEKAGWFGTGLGTAMCATLATLIFTLMVWWTTRALEDAEGARHTAENNLRRSERELADFFENAGIPLHWVGPDGKILRVNDEELTLLGYSREEYLGRHIADFHADKAVIDDILARLAAGETLEEYPARLRCKDGSIRDVLIQSSVYWEDGKFIHTRSFTRDVTEFKRAEAARARLAAIVESSDDAILSKNLDGVVTSWNAGAERIFGYSAEEMIGQPITKIIPAERQDEEKTILQRLRAGERIEHFETQREAKDGRRIEVSLTISPVRDREGRIVGASKISRDITQRKQVEAALAQQREWFAVTLASIGDAVIATDAESAVTFLNGVAEAMTGWPSADAIGRPLEEVFRIVNEKTHAKAENPVERVLREGIVVGLATHTALLARDGRVISVEDSAAPIKDSQRRVIGVVMVFRDVTSQRLVDNARAERGRLLMLRAGVAIQIASAERLGGLLQRCCELLGRHLDAALASIWTLSATEPVLELRASAGTFSELDGSHSRVSVGKEKIGRVAQERRPTLATGLLQDPDISDPAWVQREGVVAFGGYPLILEDRLLGVLAVFLRRELSQTEFEELSPIADGIAQLIERKRAETSLRAAKDQAESASKAKDQFLAALSHELRTPLTPVLMLAASMERSEELPPQVRRDFAMIRQNVELEARIIDDLLDLTRITQGKLALRFEQVDPHLLITHALDILRHDFEEKGLVVTLDFAAVEHHVSADAVRLEQVFWNVIKNAVKFTPGGGQITVRSSNTDGHFHLAVADSGIGITPEELPRIFNAFAQGAEAAAPGFGGLGLGLSISALLVHEHRGRIWAESAGRDRGATFHIELPLVSAPGPVPSAAAPAPASARALRILLVEDHPATRETLARLLTRSGHQVETADCVAQAIEMAGRDSIDIVISDLGLPDGDGHDLMRALRRDFGLRGIALSGYGMQSDIEKSNEAGFVEHLTKPIDLTALEEAIQRVIGSPGGLSQ